MDVIRCSRSLNMPKDVAKVGHPVLWFPGVELRLRGA